MGALRASLRGASARFGFALLVLLDWQGVAVDCLAQEKGGQAMSQEEADRARALERQREMMESDRLRRDASEREAELKAREAAERARIEAERRRERERSRERRPPDPVETGPVTGTEGVVVPGPY